MKKIKYRVEAERLQKENEWLEKRKNELDEKVWELRERVEFLESLSNINFETFDGLLNALDKLCEWQKHAVYGTEKIKKEEKC